MTLLILGLALFLGVHSIRIVADSWRSQQAGRVGLMTWKAIYSLLSLAGLVLIIWGYRATRLAAVELWSPPQWLRLPASLLMLLAFVLLAAAYVPRNHLKAGVGHPMVVGVKVWAFAHLLTNGTLGDVMLFGAFLAWAVLDFRALRRRDRASGRSDPPGALIGDLATVAVGVGAWAVFAWYLHLRLIGVPVA
jgi:uncharacterized membrane protein